MCPSAGRTWSASTAGDRRARAPDESDTAAAARYSAPALQAGAGAAARLLGPAVGLGPQSSAQLACLQAPPPSFVTGVCRHSSCAACGGRIRAMNESARLLVVDDDPSVRSMLHE